MKALILAAGILLASAASIRAEDGGWVAYRAAQHGFAASFPSAPKVDAGRTSPQDPITVIKYGSADKTGRLFVVIVYEFSTKVPPPDSAPQDLEKTLQVYGSGSRTTARNQHPAKIDGHPGIEAVMEDPSGNEYELVDITVAGRRMFVVVSSGRKGHETTPEAARFRDSFRLLE